jgi:hypothetical protein
MLTRTAHDIDGVPLDELVALADDTIPAERRAEVETRVASSAVATEALRAQRRAVAAMRAFDPPTPSGLERRLSADAPSRPAPLRRYQLALAGACAAAVLAFAIAMSISGGPGLTVAAVAEVSARPALEPRAPAGDGEAHLARSFAGVMFPDWGREQGWHAIGARRDEVGGRPTDTVYYRHTHHTIGYTVLSGEPLGLPARGSRVERDGLPIQLYRDGRRTVAVFERNGRTCVLAGVVHRPSTLVRLASWRANGALTF